MERKVVAEFGKAPHRYQVVGSRKQQFGYSIFAEISGGNGFISIKDNMSKFDATCTANRLAETAEWVSRLD